MATTKSQRAARLTAESWTDAALEAIAEGGLAAVSVEGLARRLGVTKGSFYWHFETRDGLVKATLSAWEAGETIEVARMLAPMPDAASRLRVLLRAALDDRPGARVEAGLLTDSSVPVVNAALERATRARTGYLRTLFEHIGVDAPQDRAITGFALYLGLLHLRRSRATDAPRGRELDRYVDHVCHWLITSVGPGTGPGVS